MDIRIFALGFFFCVLLVQVSGEDGRTCYNCGYIQRNGGAPEPLPDHEIEYCPDLTNGQSPIKKCADPNDCCIVRREFKNVSNSETGKYQTDLVVVHGCQESTTEHYNVSCTEASEDINGNCQMFEMDNTVNQDETLFKAEICLCNKDRCNNKVPDDFSSTPSAPTTTPYNGPKTKCYDCGYMQINNDPPAHLPETDPAAFCGDFANPSDLEKECLGASDCCSVIKVFHAQYNDQTKVNDTVTVVRHGCFNDLGQSEHYGLSCADASGNINEDCKVFADDKLPVNHETDVFREEVCMCKQELCNNQVPTTTTSNPTTTAGAVAITAGHIISLLASAVLSLTFL
ncbi:uncharacterized protein LOC111716413 [Eurytemora carolleeae]|uniref:uncharacterized protein LOC111716413 n=1 Tax=Eurytemora carolleeae TaxID=1294199 RepID=UPI000C773B10|nr:uncharacterized protein LOC111716413 [Eurytemora carolleeae]|eukprot:XP_023347637.1 uncharacterized protein LOC111716413 [Eurytemora affinis]